MQLLRNISIFKAYIKDKLDIYKKVIRAQAEQSCTVWTSGLTKGNQEDIERIKKSAVRLILGSKFTTCQKAIEERNIETSKERRKSQFAKFAQHLLKNNKTKNMFKKNTKKHNMRTRHETIYFESKVRKMRMKNSAIPYMEKLLNSE